MKFLSKKSGNRASEGSRKGSQTRQHIVDRALHIAGQEGLGALSIGRLAEELKMSKSGLFVHFGSKETLESAVVERARVHFVDHIRAPVEEKGLEGIERVWALCDAWLDFVEQGILPGGYFFTGAYFQCARQSGSIPEQIKRVALDWLNALRKAIDQAKKRGEIRRTIDAEQAAFELNSILIGAQWSYLMTRADQANSRLGILAKLGEMATEEIPVRAFGSVKAWKTYLKNRES